MISEQTKLLESEDGSIDPWYADEGYPPIEARLTIYHATVVQGPMALFGSSRSPAKTFSLRCVLIATCQASTHLLVTSTAPPAFLAGITGDSPGPPAHTACAKKVVPGDPRRPALQLLLQVCLLFLRYCPARENTDVYALAAQPWSMHFLTCITSYL